MSFNIRFDNPKDLNHPWAQRQHLIAKLVNEYKPHVFMTQEGRMKQLLELNQLLPHHSLVQGHRHWIHERMYPCLFVLKKEVDVLQSGDVWLSKTPYEAGSASFDSAFPRLFTWAQLTIDKHSFGVANVHLDHVKPQTRKKQAEVMMDEIAKIKHFTPYFLAGDFNEGPNEEVRRLIFSKNNSLKDPWLELKKEEETSYHHFQGHIGDGKRIDWILAPPEYRASKVAMIKGDIDGVYPSDHFPLQFNFIKN